jgi:hypothetical protein
MNEPTILSCSDPRSRFAPRFTICDHEPNETLSAAEEYALLTGEEIFAASRETSSIFNGRVLARAIVIVQTRIRCLSLPEFAKKMDIPRMTMYRHARGNPCSATVFRRAMRDLAILLDEEGHAASVRV